MVIFSFPTSWFSRHGENKNPTTSGEATSGRICFLPQVLNHKWGMKIFPWVTNGEFYQSLLLLRWGLTFLYCKWKWSILTFFTLLTRKNFSLRLMRREKNFLYDGGRPPWHGKKFLYHGGRPPWHGKNFLCHGGRIGIGSGIFHLVVQLIHFHLQFRNDFFW